MPKRNLNLFTEENRVEYQVSDIFTEEELLQDEKCYEILTNQHFFDFEYKLENKIHNLFKYYSNIYCDEDFLCKNNDNNGEKFLPLIYKHIKKKYDFELLYENPKFTNHLFDKEEKTNKVIKKVSKKIIIKNNKKHVWG